MPFVLELLTLKLSQKEIKALDQARKGTHLSREAMLKKALLQISIIAKGERIIEQVKKRNAELDQDLLIDEIDSVLQKVRSKRG